MREIDHDGLMLCRIQGDIFEASLTECGCSSPIFIRRFMNSRFAERMDSDDYLDASDAPNAAFAELDEQYGQSSYGTARYDADLLHWMGYLYRYWVYTRQMPSAEVYQIVPARELATLFPAYHSLDPAQAISRILESKGLDQEEDFTKRGVEALRALRAKDHFEYAVVDLYPADSPK